jgi:hypothetical protein
VNVFTHKMGEYVRIIRLTRPKAIFTLQEE